MNSFESKPFKFENFKTAEKVKSYLDEHYLGKGINVILEDLSKVGAECMVRPEKIPKHQISINLDGEYDRVYVCDYRNNFISFDPFGVYYFSLYVDDSDKLIGIFVKKKSKLEIP